MNRRLFAMFAAAMLLAGPAVAQQIDSMTLKPIVKAVREGDEDKVRAALLKPPRARSHMPPAPADLTRTAAPPFCTASLGRRLPAAL